nr:nitric oxide synthase-interacting protein isoform X2 [Odocoileus virginianus texanus]
MIDEMRLRGVGPGVRGQAVSLVLIPMTAQRSNAPSLAVPLLSERKRPSPQSQRAWPQDKQPSAKYHGGSRQLTTKNRVGNLSLRRMTRHGKNCTAGAVYTYHEKKKDTAASGYGTQNIRLSRDAVKDFDCCCLSLQPCHDPVVTPDGYLYEREAILEYILHQKKEIARQMKAYEKQRGARREEQKALQRAAAQDHVRGFLEKEAAIVSRPLNPFTPKVASAGSGPDDAQPGSSAGPAGKDKDKALPSFWIPSLTPEAKATKLEKPPLRMSDLTPVRFTPLDSSVDRVGLITRSERYVCAVTRDSLSNATPCAVLRPSGAVVTLECVEKLIRKDMVDPVTGDKLTDRDIIVLQRGGTGFAGSGVKLQAEKSRPVMQA